jgi:hypothetical protein
MRFTAFLFTATVFASAFLLFLVQPMVGKMILPRFGGAPAVWNTCMAFFQVLLLAGYAYAHFSSSRLGVRPQSAAQLALLALAAIPLAVPEGGATGEENPIGRLLLILFATTGLTFFVLSTTAPLLQHWYASLDGPPRNPYPLYAASNAGSLLALIGYPAVVEPALGLRAQRLAWFAGYAALAALMAGCAAVVWRRGVSQKQLAVRGEPVAAVGASRRLRWVLLAFVPSALLLGLTTHLSQTIAPVPLLWVLPLALYLLSFVLAFAELPAVVFSSFGVVFPVALLYLVYSLFMPAPSKGWLVLTHLAVFFVTATVLHGELARLRPPSARLTEFYLWMSLGGSLGGCFVAFVAPLVFPGIWEYRLSLVAAALLWAPHLWLPGSLARYACLRRLAGVALPVALGVAVAVGFASGDNRDPYSGTVLHRERNFFGVIRVERGRGNKTQRLVHGNIWHGAQLVSEDPRQRRLPLLYFFPTGPIGQFFHSFPKVRKGLRVGVIGLGTGALASYAEPGDEWTFFEIDRAVERIAEDPQWFTYLSEAKARGADLRVVPGDARLTLATEPDGHYRVLVVDAFSGDAIPIHLLTREAIELYLSKLSTDGILAVHVTNSYLELEPVFAEHARAMGLAGRAWDQEVTREEYDRGKFPSKWLLLARREEDLAFVKGNWTHLKGRPGFRQWVDDYSNLLSVFNW